MFKGCVSFYERKNVFPFHAPLRIFHSLQRVFSKNEKSVKGHELLIVSKTFFLSFFKCLSNITSCYVNVGWPVTGFELLYFADNNSNEGLANSEGKGSERGKSFKDERSEYEAKPNENASAYKIFDNQKELAEKGITPDHPLFPQMYKFRLKPLRHFYESLEELN